MDILPGIEDEVFEEVENNILTEKMNKIIQQTLQPREAEIINLRFGLNGNRPLTQREVAKKLGISRSYISRLETKAMETIKQEVERKKILE